MKARVSYRRMHTSDLIGLYRLNTMIGQLSGAAMFFAGFVLCLLGLSGSIEWIVESSGATSRLTNASPGVFFALLGALVLWAYKARIDHRSGTNSDLDKSDREFELDNRNYPDMEEGEYRQYEYEQTGFREDFPSYLGKGDIDDEKAGIRDYSRRESMRLREKSRPFWRASENKKS